MVVVKMELYFCQYVPISISMSIYEYIGWKYLMRHSAPGIVWDRISDYFCQDAMWKKQYVNYIECDQLDYTSKERILFFLNYLLTEERENIPPIMWSNRDFVLLYVRYQQEYELYMDNEQSIKSIPKSNDLLDHISAELKSEAAFISAAVQGNLCAMFYASDELTSDRVWMLDVIRKNACAFAFASDALKNDRSFVLESVKCDGWLLNLIPSIFSIDQEIVLTALTQTSRVWYQINPVYKSDRNFVRTALNKNGEIYGYLEEKFRNDKELTMIAAKHNIRLLKFMAPSLKKNRNFILDLLKLNLEAKNMGDVDHVLNYIDDTLKLDQKFIKKAARISCPDDMDYVMIFKDSYNYMGDRWCLEED